MTINIMCFASIQYQVLSLQTDLAQRSDAELRATTAEGGPLAHPTGPDPSPDHVAIPKVQEEKPHGPDTRVYGERSVCSGSEALALREGRLRDFLGGREDM
jgi:hypothetical protein